MKKSNPMNTGRDVLIDTSRLKLYIDAIVNGGAAPEPITRVDFFLAKIAGEEVTPPEPLTRIEFLLARIAGADAPLPEQPYYRIELYLAKIAGEDVAMPRPETATEQLLAEWAAGSDRRQLESGKPL